jgi:type II secretory pathway pseudopilin PulG
MVFSGKLTKILKKGGITLIELLISVAILILILSFGPFVSVKTLRDYQISQEANYLVSNLRFLQYLSLYQKDDSSFGISFSEAKYSLFEKPSDKDIEIFQSHPLPKGFKINGPKEIIFEKNTGKPLWNGTINILEITKGEVVFHKREISINPEGNVEILK